MEINVDTTVEDYHPIEHKKNKTHVHIYSNRASLLFIKGIILPGLVLVALIPRIILAHQLDLVTDEIIYIMGGKGYFPLLLHFRFTSNLWSFNYEHPPL